MKNDIIDKINQLTESVKVLTARDLSRAQLITNLQTHIACLHVSQVLRVGDDIISGGSCLCRIVQLPKFDGNKVAIDFIVQWRGDDTFYTVPTHEYLSFVPLNHQNK